MKRHKEFIGQNLQTLSYPQSNLTRKRNQHQNITRTSLPKKYFKVIQINKLHIQFIQKHKYTFQQYTKVN